MPQRVSKEAAIRSLAEKTAQITPYVRRRWSQHIKSDLATGRSIAKHYDAWKKPAQS